MKPPSAWFEMSAVAVLLTVMMFVVMWARQPDASCAMPVEPARQLVISRDTDREHLSRDVSLAGHAARRYMLSTADAAERHLRFMECSAALVEEIATRHGLPQDTVRAGLTDGQ